MKQTVFDFKALDGVVLSGLLYEPEQTTKVAAIYLHGNGSNSVFYSTKKLNVIASALADKGITFFPFNNRGAHLLKKLNVELPDGSFERRMFGSAFELLEECRLDIDGALKELRGRGYETFFLIGASTGANKICIYNKLRPENNFLKYVLVAGGDDTGIYFEHFGKEKFEQLLKLSKEKTALGEGRAMVPQELVGEGMYYSFQSLGEMLDPNGDYNCFPFIDIDYEHELGLGSKPHFLEYSKIAKDHAIIYGDQDEYLPSGVESAISTIKHHSNKGAQIEYIAIPGADHGFMGKELQLAQSIADYLAE